MRASISPVNHGARSVKRCAMAARAALSPPAGSPASRIATSCLQHCARVNLDRGDAIANGVHASGISAAVATQEPVQRAHWAPARRTGNAVGAR